MSLLHTTVWLKLSHICNNLSCPAVANWGKVGCAASPQTSSAWPSIAGLKPMSFSPTRMQFLVVPINNWVPLPSESVRIPPKWSLIYRTNYSLFFRYRIIYFDKIEKHMQTNFVLNLSFPDVPGLLLPSESMRRQSTKSCRPSRLPW